MPKILWFSPYSLHDSNSGCLIHCKEMLESLTQASFEVWACSSFVFEHPETAQIFEDLEYKLNADPHNTFILEHNGISYIYTRCTNRDESEFTLAEGQLFYDTFMGVLDHFKPDIVIGNSFSPLSINCFAEAKRRSIGTVFMLLNEKLTNFRFPHIDLVLTDSISTTKLYENQVHLNIIPTGAIFANKQRFMANQYNRQYVTFINPCGQKGLAIFAKLVLICKQRLPKLRFLVVNLETKFSEQVSTLHQKDLSSEHPFAVKDFTNVDMTDMPKDLRAVYQITKVLLAPSISYESWHHHATEAVFNGIPVLASNLSAMSESIDQAGICLDIPQHCQQDYLSIPTDEEIEPWFEALKKLLSESWEDKIKQAQHNLDSHLAMNKVMTHLHPLCLKRPGDHARFLNGY